MRASWIALIAALVVSVGLVGCTATTGAVAATRGRSWLVRVAAGQAIGSGVIVRSDGLIATSQHVIAGARAIQVTLPNGDKPYAQVTAADSNLDLALLKVDAKNLSAARLADTSRLQQGDSLIAIGYALDLPGEPTVNSGVLSAKRPIGGGIEILQMDAALSPGMSGGPVLTTKGELAGIAMARIRGESLNFAMPAEAIKHLIERPIAQRPTATSTLVVRATVTPTPTRRLAATSTPIPIRPATATPLPTRTPAPPSPTLGPSSPYPSNTWTVVLHGALASSADALAKAQVATEQFADVGVLFSTEYPNLQPGYWVVYTGWYDSESRAVAAATEARRKGYAGAYPRWLGQWRQSPMGTSSEPTAVEATVRDYYLAINQRRYRDAYNNLSRSAQAHQSYAAFEQQFSRTLISIRDGAVKDINMVGNTAHLSVQTTTLSQQGSRQVTECWRVDWSLVLENGRWKRDTMAQVSEAC